MIKSCRTCGSRFEAKNSQVYCADHLPKSVLRIREWRRTGIWSRAERRCAVCLNPIDRVGRGRGWFKYCSICKPPPKKTGQKNGTIERQCKVCGKAFLNNGNKKTCSKECGMENWKNRLKEARSRFRIKHWKRVPRKACIRCSTELAVQKYCRHCLEEVKRERSRDRARRQWAESERYRQMHRIISRESKRRQTAFENENFPPELLALKREREKLVSAINKATKANQNERRNDQEQTQHGGYHQGTHGNPTALQQSYA